MMTEQALSPPVCGHQWIEIPAGFSCLGSDDTDPYAGEKERPLREVFIPTFLISKFPTTNEQIAAFYAATGWEPHPEWSAWWRRLREDERAEHRRFPATHVSWDIAAAYSAWLGEEHDKAIGLPTEAEWEKAARGGDARIWPWGDVFDPSRCCCAELGNNDFCSVDDFASGCSPFGVAHMSGLVWEWCIDHHHADNHASAETFAPANFTPARQRVVKGGSAFCTKEIVRIACRDWTNQINQGGGDDGFRVVWHVR
ncbi:formylglycine-generating enzyme family protein [Mesorhizobium sp. IMUNJ 23033]|uniref:formylglycine-generating enzyme family protein n=1 Tax=Mesorhizobium sp. IMUNJ 23033 TaxID=3378039 RepID=UPI00384E9AC4